MPEITSFGVLGVFCTVIPGRKIHCTLRIFLASLISYHSLLGLLIGAVISKNIASFLEENDLFVPSEDDDDD